MIKYDPSNEDSKNKLEREIKHSRGGNEKEKGAR